MYKEIPFTNGGHSQLSLHCDFKPLPSTLFLRSCVVLEVKECPMIAVCETQCKVP